MINPEEMLQELEGKTIKTTSGSFSIRNGSVFDEAGNETTSISIDVLYKSLKKKKKSTSKKPSTIQKSAKSVLDNLGMDIKKNDKNLLDFYATLPQKEVLRSVFNQALEDGTEAARVIGVIIDSWGEDDKASKVDLELADIIVICDCIEKYLDPKDEETVNIGINFKKVTVNSLIGKCKHYKEM